MFSRFPALITGIISIFCLTVVHSDSSTLPATVIALTPPPILITSSMIASPNTTYAVDVGASGRRLLQVSCDAHQILVESTCVCDSYYYQGHLSSALSTNQFDGGTSMGSIGTGWVMYMNTDLLQLDTSQWYGTGCWHSGEISNGISGLRGMGCTSYIQTQIVVDSGNFYVAAIDTTIMNGQSDAGGCSALPVTGQGVTSIEWKQNANDPWIIVRSLSDLLGGLSCDQTIQSQPIGPVQGSSIYVRVGYDVSMLGSSTPPTFVLKTVKLYETLPECTHCPLGYTSNPGAVNLVDCYINNGVELNVTMDWAGLDVNQSTFDALLPENIQALTYEDQIDIYLESCPTGYFCVSDTTRPAACPAGTYRDTTGATQLSECILCPSGHYCPIATTTPLTCLAGTYRTTGGGTQPTDCSQCLSGNYCPEASVFPVKCVAGTYRDATGASLYTQCIPCTAGSFCPIETTTPTACAAGSYRGNIGGANQTDCMACTEGHYCPITSTSPTTCPEGTFGNGTGLDQLSDCQACLVGQYCPTGSIIPVDCAAGSYRPTIGATAQEFCDICTTGHYCPARSVQPTPCAAGTYLNGTGGTQSTSCVPCTEGHYCPGGSTVPTTCPAGTFRDVPGATQIAECYTCPSGQYCPETSVTPTSCLPGTYRATAGAIEETQCILCPSGDYCPFATTVPTHCPAGTYRGTAGGVDRFSCTICPSGNYCPEQSINPTNCSAGTYNPNGGGAAVADCIECPTGVYCPLATTTPTACVAGTYRDTPSAIQQSDCSICTIGHYCLIQTTNPNECAAGSYRPTTGATKQADCEICTTGNYCPQGSINPVNCPATKYRPTLGGASSMDCMACPPGRYCPIQTTTPTPCNAGTYRLAPSGAVQGDCTICPAGSYCTIGTVTPVPCGAGTHRDSVGATQLSNCLLCLPGTYSLAMGRSSNCPLCDANFYCRTSTMKEVCPLHTTSSSGAYSRVNCRCDPGYQCTYYKQIQAVVTLNATLWEFNNDIGGVRTAFIAAMAAAAGVQPSQVTINGVVIRNRRRNLLSVSAAFAVDDNGTNRQLLSVPSDSSPSRSQQTIEVHTSVIGSTRLRDLDKHLDRHNKNLHITHRWEQAHKVMAVPLENTAMKTEVQPAVAKPAVRTASTASFIKKVKAQNSIRNNPRLNKASTTQIDVGAILGAIHN
jgi:hypothetical protein